jgi:hypothetical protein
LRESWPCLILPRAMPDEPLLRDQARETRCFEAWVSSAPRSGAHGRPLGEHSITRRLLQHLECRETIVDGMRGRSPGGACPRQPGQCRPMSSTFGAKDDAMKYLGLVIALALSMLGQSSAQEIDRSRLRSDEPVPASVSIPPRGERREQVEAPTPPAVSAPTPSPAQYNVEDPHAVIDWLFNRSAVRGR